MYALKQEFIKWLDNNFIKDEDLVALAEAKKLVRKEKWDTIIRYQKVNGHHLFKPLMLGSIFTTTSINNKVF